MTQPLLSATLIARNEKPNVRRCLDSLWEACDEIVVVDTGSTDGTVAELRRYAKERHSQKKLKILRTQWAGDFAAARNQADALASGRWLVWADLDDTVTNLSAIREMLHDASDDVRGYFCRYRYAADPDGNPISELWRERVVRNDGTRWEGRLHEHKLFTGGHVVKVSPELCEWVHHRDHENRTAARNLEILEAWLADEPENPRVIQSMAMELMGEDRHEEAAAMFDRYLQHRGEPQDRRCQAFRHMAVMLMLSEKPAQARSVAYRALQENPLWADTYLTLAESEQTLGRPQAALVHAQTALRLGKPDTLLIVNPLQYTAHPHAVMAVCYGQLGRYEEAVSEAQEALAIAPSYSLAKEHLPRWQGQLRRQHALGAFLGVIDILVGTGELVKAQAQLDNAPFFITDDPQVIAKRVQVAELIQSRSGRPRDRVDEAADRFIERHQEAA